MRRVLIACVLAGCDPLADSSYVGDPLFTLVGTLAAAPGESADGIALMWQDPTGARGPGLATTALPVAIEFPATFRVAVPVPPPDEARFTFSDSPVAIAEAYVFVVADPQAPRPIARGVDRTHVLVYATGDVEAGTLAADYLGGPLRAGYHLRRFTPVTAVTPAQAQMIERCATTSLASACSARRSYALVAADDGEQLRIVVAPP